MHTSLPPYHSPAELPMAPLAAASPADVYRDPPGYDEDEGAGVPWARYFDVLRRHLLFILIVTGLGSVAGWFVSRRVSAIYEAQATVWINATNGQQSGPIRAEQLLPSASYVDLLRSFAIIDAVVQRLKLNVYYRSPGDSLLFRDLGVTTSLRPGTYILRTDTTGRAYSLATPDDVVVERGAVGDSIGRALGFAWRPTAASLRGNRRVPFTVVPPRTGSLGLLSRMRASLPENGQFLTISLSGTDGRLTASTVNAWAEQFVRSATDLKKRHLLEFQSILGDQLALAETELRRSEIQLEQFRVNTITLPSENGAPLAGGVQATRDPVFTNFFQQKQTLEEVRNDRLALERLFADAHGGPLNAQGFLLLPSVLNNTPQLRAAIDELSTRQAALRSEQQYLTDANPRVKQLAEAVRVLERETIPQIAQSTLVSLRARERDLGSRLVSQSGQLRAIPTRTIEEMRLLRQVAASDNLYGTLKGRYEQVSLSVAESTPDLTVLDSAVAPMRPTSNEAPRLLLLSVLASVGVAIGLALLHDRLDRRFRYPEQATTELRLPIAGTVPRFRPSRRGRFDVDTMSQAVESFRSLRLGLRYAFPRGTPLVLSVSSPGPGDGKSLVSSNLALSFASAGQRTLLIDGDVRCGTQHGTFSVPAAPGLVDYLQAAAEIGEVVKSTASENLYVLPCGSRQSRAPELLVSDRMMALVGDMRRRFDVVIIDSPPFVAGMDAYALAAAAGNMVVVLRPAVTDRKLAAAKLEILDRLPVRVLGCILNGVSDGGVYRYSRYAYGDGGTAGLSPGGDVATPKGLVQSA